MLFHIENPLQPEPDGPEDADVQAEAARERASPGQYIGAGQADASEGNDRQFPPKGRHRRDLPDTGDRARRSGGSRVPLSTASRLDLCDRVFDLIRRKRGSKEGHE
jgi:hypothetical protein